MTDQDLLFLADELNCTRPAPKGNDLFAWTHCPQWRSCIEKVADALSRVHARFDGKRFIEAYEDDPSCPLLAAIRQSPPPDGTIAP
jgi:hypothetical protein